MSFSNCINAYVPQIKFSQFDISVTMVTWNLCSLLHTWPPSYRDILLAGPKPQDWEPILPAIKAAVARSKLQSNVDGTIPWIYCEQVLQDLINCFETSTISTAPCVLAFHQRARSGILILDLELNRSYCGHQSTSVQLPRFTFSRYGSTTSGIPQCTLKR